MSFIFKVDDQAVTMEQFIKELKLSDKFDKLLKDMIREKVAVCAAKKKGIEVLDEELQQEVDEFRAERNLHRAKETHEWLEKNKVDLDEFETYIVEKVYLKKVMASVCSDEAINNYFELNSPLFDTVDIQRIVVDDEDKAREIVSLLEEEPEEFEDLAKEHSLDPETAEKGGFIGGIKRGSLPQEAAAKVFTAEEGSILGPSQIGDENLYEIIMVASILPAKLDENTRQNISILLYEQWLQTQVQEHSLEID